MTTITATGSSSPIAFTGVPAGTYTATVTAHNNSGNGPSSTPISVTVTGSATNLISNLTVQHASAISEFTVTSGTITLDTTVYQEGSSSVKLTTTASGAYPTLKASTPSIDGAPVTAASQYTGVVSIRPTTNTITYNLILAWFNSSNTYLSSSTGANVSCTAGSWTQIYCTATAPSTAAYAIIQVQPVVAMGSSGDSFNVDEFGIFAGTNTTWTASGSGIADFDAGSDYDSASFSE